MRRLLGGRASHVDQAPALVTPASAAAAGAGAGAVAGGEQASNASFDANMVIILAALLCVLICALGLNSVIRCAIHCARRLAPPSGATTAATTARPAPSVTVGLKKKALSRIPVEVYGPKAGVPATECAICLGDFADGEKVRVLPRCHHGFHVRCIDMWLATHSSCPTCRDSLLEEGVTAAATAAAQGRQRAAGQYNATGS